MDAPPETGAGPPEGSPALAEIGWFAARTHVTRLALLTQLLQAGNRLLVLEGPEGSGRTALMARLIRTVPAGWRPLMIDGHTQPGPLRLVARIAEALDAPAVSTDLHSLLRAVSARAMGLAAQGSVPILIVDDADRLPPPTLDFLGRLAAQNLTGDEPGLRIVLVTASGPGALSSLRGAEIERLELGPLAEDEARAYIEERWRGWNMARVAGVSDAAFAKRVAECAGWPGALDGLARELGQFASSDVTPPVLHEAEPSVRSAPGDAARVPLTWRLPTLGLLALGLIAIAYFWPGSEEQATSTATEPSAQGQAQEPVAPAEGVQPSVPAVTTPPVSPPPVAEPPASVPAPAPMPAPVPAADVSPPLPPATPSPAANAAEPLHDAAWIAAQPPTHYTIQLMTLASVAEVQRTVKRNGLPAPVAWFAASRNGRTQFIVVQGSYASLAEARAALDALPEALKRARPWPRRMRDVQAEAGRDH